MVNAKFLRSRVARRVFTLFVVCALVPMAVLTAVSVYQVSGQLRVQHQRDLQHSAKSVGLGIFERLGMLDSELQLAALRIQQGDPLPAPSTVHFQTLTLWKERSRPGGSANPLSSISAAEIAHLRSGKSSVRVEACSADQDKKCVVVTKLVDPVRPASGLIVGEADSSYLWGADHLPADVDLCVLDPQGLVYSSDRHGFTETSIPSSRSASGFFEWKNQSTSYEAAYRDLFLRAEYSADTWTIILSQDHRDALASLQHFRDSFVLVALLAVWIVVLLSLIQIRRTMGPLEKLGEGTKQIAEQNFDARVEITSGDEFQDLAASFNSMSSRLAQQFHTLRTINEIDQAILSSLNRDTVVDTVLSRMTHLLPCECFAIALFQPGAPDTSSVQLSLRERHAGSQMFSAHRMAWNTELQQLEDGRARQIPLQPQSTPDYLRPLKDRGMASAFVFPILLEQRVFAALACGLSPQTSMTSEDIVLAGQVADQLAVAFSNVRLIEALEQLHWGTLTALARAIDAKSEWTAGHSERVTHLALRIGRVMGLPPRELQIMHRGGLLHDVGKIGTPPQVLDKPGKLEPAEMQTMRDHVRIGVRILEPIGAFTDALPIVAQHHEWFNGQGYPAGLKGEEISLHARIFAVADCYDAMVSDRPYRKGLPRPKVVEMLREKAGTQFDPEVIEAFVRLCGEDEALGAAEGDLRLAAQPS
ncbi:MAG: HD domain-containing phosphohydrolase [Terriglobales bacterium]